MTIEPQLNRCKSQHFLINGLVMSRGKPHICKRLIALPIVVPICLFLISFGIRVPDLSNLCSTPKPRPRAVVETTSKNTSKTGHHAPSKQVHAVALSEEPPSLVPPQAAPTRFFEESHDLVSITPPQTGARAPPLSNC